MDAPPNDNALKPLAGVDGDRACDEAWQAEALAIADTLVQGGLFTANEWSEALGAALRRAEAEGAVDDQETYYRCVLTTLESLISEHSDIDHSTMASMRKDWEDAYRSTPHGQPVLLARDRES